MTHEALGDENRALQFYPQAQNLSADKSPQSAAILVTYGKFLLSLWRSQDGIEKHRQALVIDPGSRDAHYELAKRFEHEGDFRNAALEGERALALPLLGTSDAHPFSSRKVLSEAESTRSGEVAFRKVPGRFSDNKQVNCRKWQR